MISGAGCNKKKREKDRILQLQGKRQDKTSAMLVLIVTHYSSLGRKTVLVSI